MSVLVSQSLTQDASFTIGGWLTACGPRIYTISPSLSFVSITNNILTASPTLPANAGTYSVSVTVKLQDYPTVPAMTKTFTLTVTCSVLSLGFAASTPSTKTLQLGIDAQPFNIPYAVTKSPLCPQSPTFTMTPTNLTWLTKTSSGDGGNVVVNGAT